MLGVTNAGSIRLVLSGPAVRRTFAFALVGRLSYGLLPLCLLFTIRDASDSFAIAASTSAALAIATMAMPLQARLVDRYGQRRVLPVYATGYITTLTATAVLSASSHPDWLWLAMGVLLGVTAPALGPATRAQWREITQEGPARRTAYSLDSIAEESLYLIGPLMASVVLATGPPRIGLVLAAALIAIGTAALVASPYVPESGAPIASPDVPPRTIFGVLEHTKFRRFLLVMVSFGAAGAACFVGVAALADRAGKQSALGLIEAAAAVGAILAGLAWTRLRAEPAWPVALAALLLLIAGAEVGTLLAAPDLLLVGAFAIVCGAAAAPFFVVAYTAADGLVPPDQRTEASTWVSTAINGGSAGGTAVAGLVLAVGPVAPFALAALLSGVTGAVVLIRRPS